MSSVISLRGLGVSIRCSAIGVQRTSAMTLLRAVPKRKKTYNQKKQIHNIRKVEGRIAANRNIQMRNAQVEIANQILQQRLASSVVSPPSPIQQLEK